MIQSFFVWLLGPELSLIIVLAIIFFLICAFNL